MSEMSEANSNHSNRSDNGNGNGHAAEGVLLADDLDVEQQRRLAGLDEVEAEESLLPTEYSIDIDRPVAKEKTAKDKPGLQSLFVLTMVGGVVGIVCLFVFVIWSGGGGQTQQAQQPEKKEQAPLLETDETAALRSRLAFQDQQRLLQQQQQQAKPAQPTPAKPGQPTPPAAPATPPPAPRTIAAYTPPMPARSFSPAPAASSAPAPQSAPQVDPFDRWSQLANLGSAQGSFSPEETTTAAASTIDTPTVEQVAAAPQMTQPQPGILLASSQISSVTIGHTPTPENGMTPGARGIMSRTPYRQTAASGSKSVLIGTATTARVAMPMLWDGVSNSPGLQRFTVELTQPLMANDGSIALPAGTLFVAEAHQVAEGNNMVVASAVAVLYKDRNGTLQQQMLQPGDVLIRGTEGTALIAEKVHDPGGAIAGQDLLVGVLSSLGRIGEIVNQPREQTTTVGVGFSQTSSSSDPEVWAAALDGFFGVTADRLRERSDEMVDEMLARPNVMVLPENTQVAIVVNSFLQVNR